MPMTPFLSNAGDDLLAAIRNHGDDAVRRLMAVGVDPNAVIDTQRDWTPLLVASLCGTTDCVRCLLEAGADLNTTDPNEGLTALMMAAEQGRADVAAVLLAFGADATITRTWWGRTALHQAALCDRAEVVRVLIEAGADPDARDGRGHRPEDLASGAATRGVFAAVRDRAALLRTDQEGADGTNGLPLGAAARGRRM